MLRKMIVSAAPTCTLWIADMKMDYLRFRFNRHWRISRLEIENGPAPSKPLRMILRDWMKAKASAILARCVISELVADGLYPETAKRIVDREIKAIAKDALETFSWEKSEQRILDDRLNRRFDLGQSLNESANRAIAAKKAEKSTLSSPQSAALKFQKEYLERIVRNS